MDMNRAFGRAQDGLTKAVHAAVKKAWPSLVAVELAKLSNHKVSAPKRHTEYKSRDERFVDIKKLKAKHPKMTQGAIARKLGLTQGYVSRIVRGLKYTGKTRVSAKPVKTKPVKSVKSSKKKLKPAAVKPIEKQLDNQLSISMKDALAKYGTRTEASKALGLPRQTFSDRLAKELTL